MNHDEKEEHDIFIDDTPIKTAEEDILDRENFVTHLSNALVGWRQSKSSESIVIALCGKWGSGKSSIINLVTSDIDENHKGNKPTIVRFNPWEFSKKGGLVKHFFNEIARKLEIYNSGEDRKTAEKLDMYVKKIGFFSSSATFIVNWLSKFFLIAGGTSVGGSLNSENIFFMGIGILAIMLGTVTPLIKRWANYLLARSKYDSKSASKLKEGISDNLRNREEKILVIIDDIDRLNQSEIKQIFQLIKVNADFPNTIYLLSFDREIVEKNLDNVQKGISGKDYMDKIVQVCFDIPVVNQSKVWDYFEKELKRVLNKLPEGTAKEYFSEDDYLRFRKANIDSELNNFIKNLRDAKRFINSLEFNLLQMHMDGHMEVNVIDFIALEAIRMNAPSFYSFMKQEKNLLTSIFKKPPEQKERIDKVQNAIKKVRPKEIKNSVSSLMEELFPQTCSDYNTYDEVTQSSEWTKELRICEMNRFGDYFTLLPGGEDKLSQFEIKNILQSADSAESLEKILMKYIDNKEINNVVTRIGDFANDKKMVPQKNIKNIIKVLFDISDNLSGSTLNICYKFLEQENNKGNALEMLKEIIPLSKGLYWPISLIYYESEVESKGFGKLIVVPEDKIEEMKKMCVEHIQSFKDSSLLKNEHLGFIMYRWYYWDKKETWKPFIERIKKDDEQLLTFIDKFISRGDLFRASLSKFLDNVDDLEEKFKTIRTENPSLYEKHKDAIDLYLTPPE